MHVLGQGACLTWVRVARLAANRTARVQRMDRCHCKATSASTCIDTATPFAHTVEPEIAQNDDIPASAGATAKPTVAAAKPENDIPEAAVQPHVAAAAKPEISFVQNRRCSGGEGCQI